MTGTRFKHSQSGTTLIETVVAATLIAAFFAAIFEVNAVCLRYIDAAKESVAALQGVQDRVEQLRNLGFSSLTSPSYMATTQPTPAPSGSRPASLTLPSDSSDLAARVTETVTVSAYPSGPTVTYTRNPGAGFVTPSYVPASPNFSGVTLVKVNVKYAWNMTFGGRPASEEAETIISAGTKK